MVTLPLLNVKSNKKKLIIEINCFNILLGDLQRQQQERKSSIHYIEVECMSNFTRFNPFDLFCSSGTGSQTGEAIPMHLRNMLARVQRLEKASTFFSSFGTSSLGSTPLPPSSTIAYSEFSSLSSKILLLKSSVCDLTSIIGEDAIEIGGVYFQSLSQTIAWVRSRLPSNAYLVFQDVMTLFDLIGTSNLINNEFLDE